MQAPGPDRESHVLRASFGWASLLVVLCVATYSPVASAGFLWDDDDNVTDNLCLRSVAGLWRAWTDHRAAQQYYPLTQTSWWLEYQLFELDPLPYHIDNVLLHALSACLLWLILCRLGVPGAWLAAAWFAVHPVHVESVAWVTERKNTLSGLLYLCAAYVYLARVDGEAAPSRRERLAYVLAFALYIAAVFAKTVTFTLPAALLLLAWWRRNRVTGRELRLLAPMQLAGIGPAALTAYIERFEVGATWHVPLIDRLLLAGRNFWFYPQKIMWPQPLMFVYPRWELSPHAATSYVYGVAALGVVVIAWRWRERVGRAPLAALLFYAVTIAPALGVFSVYWSRYAPVADHFQYLASLGSIVLLAAALTRACERLPSVAARRVLAGCSIAVLIVLTHDRARVFHDSEALWNDSIAKNPGAWLAHQNLASVLLQQKRVEQALAHAERAVAIAEEPETLTTLAMTLGVRGQHERAAATLQHLIALRPGTLAAYTNLGVELLALGRVPEAEAALRTALRGRPDDALAHNNLANILERRRSPEALDHYAAAVASAPRNAAYHGNYAMALQARGKQAEAIGEFKRALALDPRNVALGNNLAIALAMVGDMRGAIEQFERLVALDPNDMRARDNLARARQLAAGR